MKKNRVAEIEIDQINDEWKLFGGAFSCCIPGTASDIRYCK